MPTNPLGPTGLLAQSLTLPAGSQSMSRGGMRMQAQGMDGRKKSRGLAGRYLLIGGGGGAGNSFDGGGGGGAGEFREGNTTLPSGAWPVVVGLGGVGANPPTNGGLSSVAGLSSRGGGAGGVSTGVADEAIGKTGGSGGGGSSPQPSGSGAGGLGTGENTNPGGAGEGVFGSYRAGGGGGGAGGAGTAGNSSNAGSGGSGKASTITGASVLYAAGGAGQNDFVGPGSDGAGWGPNNGSGGSNGGDGQGGIFIWSYASPVQLCTGGTVTNYLDGSTRWWVHTFTSNGTLGVP